MRAMWRSMSFLDSRHQIAPQGIGKPLRRREDVRFLTGAGRYADDMNLFRLVREKSRISKGPRPPIGFRMPANRHPGRRRFGACKGRVGVRESVIHPRSSAGSRSGSRERASDRSSNDRRCGSILSTRFGLGLQCRDATLICDCSRATPSTLRVQRRAREFEPAGQAFYATGKHNQQPRTLRRLMNGEGKRVSPI